MTQRRSTVDVKISQFLPFQNYIEFPRELQALTTLTSLPKIQENCVDSVRHTV